MLSRLLGLTVVGLYLLLVVGSNAQNLQQYKALEAYQVRPGILMIVKRTTNGLVCEVGLSKLSYLTEIPDRSPGFSWEALNQIADELVPSAERGPRLKGYERDELMIRGHVTFEFARYGNIVIEMSSSFTDDPGQIQAEDGNGTIEWNNRKCK